MEVPVNVINGNKQQPQLENRGGRSYLILETTNHYHYKYFC